MNIPIEIDERYKVDQKMVDEMRELRKTGLSYQKIADKFKVSQHTVYYWCNPKYRTHKQNKNAKRRRTKEEVKIYVKGQSEKRKWKWNNIPETRIECDYWSMKSEKRTKRVSSKGRTFEELEKEYNESKSKTNQKIN